MMPPEEVLRNIEYVRCPDCHGARVFPSLLPGLPLRNCLRCQGWGFMADPTRFEERAEICLKALHPSVIIELADPPKKRLRLPIRKKHK